ncbi:MAG: hypothetical protein EHM64_00195 [Ignavibacteriae bacterium]|nr:MAG: hypothetical protein EHM64_00195 [Ignavibacteriota bacterium]
MDNLWTTRPKPAQVIHILATYLTSGVRSILAGERLKPIARGRSLVLLGALFVVSTTPAEANPNTDNLKLYAHSRVVNYEQFLCLSKIIYKESRWSVTAKNGSHFGLGQMRSKHYRNLDGYRQIDATIKYINHRYGSMCKAWAFHQKRNYY